MTWQVLHAGKFVDAHGIVVERADHEFIASSEGFSDAALRLIARSDPVARQTPVEWDEGFYSAFAQTSIKVDGRDHTVRVIDHRAFEGRPERGGRPYRRRTYLLQPCDDWSHADPALPIDAMQEVPSFRAMGRVAPWQPSDAPVDKDALAADLGALLAGRLHIGQRPSIGLARRLSAVLAMLPPAVAARLEVRIGGEATLGIKEQTASTDGDAGRGQPWIGVLRHRGAKPTISSLAGAAAHAWRHAEPAVDLARPWDAVRAPLAWAMQVEGWAIDTQAALEAGKEVPPAPVDPSPRALQAILPLLQEADAFDRIGPLADPAWKAAWAAPGRNAASQPGTHSASPAAPDPDAASPPGHDPAASPAVFPASSPSAAGTDPASLQAAASPASVRGVSTTLGHTSTARTVSSTQGAPWDTVAHLLGGRDLGDGDLAALARLPLAGPAAEAAAAAWGDAIDRAGDAALRALVGSRAAWAKGLRASRRDAVAARALALMQDVLDVSHPFWRTREGKAVQAILAGQEVSEDVVRSLPAENLVARHGDAAANARWLALTGRVGDPGARGDAVADCLRLMAGVPVGRGGGFAVAWRHFGRPLPVADALRLGVAWPEVEACLPDVALQPADATVAQLLAVPDMEPAPWLAITGTGSPWRLLAAADGSVPDARETAVLTSLDWADLPTAARHYRGQHPTAWRSIPPEAVMSWLERGGDPADLDHLAPTAPVAVLAALGAWTRKTQRPHASAQDVMTRQLGRLAWSKRRAVARATRRLEAS